MRAWLLVHIYANTRSTTEVLLLRVGDNHYPMQGLDQLLLYSAALPHTNLDTCARQT